MCIQDNIHEITKHYGKFHVTHFCIQAPLFQNISTKLLVKKVDDLYAIGFAKTILNGIFSILRNTVLNYCNNCVSLVLHYSHARLAV